MQPTLVLLDIGLPDIDGIEVAALLTAAARSRVVVLTSSRDAAGYEPLFERWGARGFIARAKLSGAAIAALAADRGANDPRRGRGHFGARGE